MSDEYKEKDLEMVDFDRPSTDGDINQDKSERNNKGKKEKKRTAFQEFLSWIATFSIAILLALFLKNYIIINATVPTGSMENTILPGDDLFGLRLAYKFPGETVSITEGKIYINGSKTPLDEPYIKDEWQIATGPFEFVVPEDSYLVLGDNRNDSWDARYWDNTYVKKEKIIGKALWIYYPFNRFGALE